MAQHPTRQSLRRTVAAAGTLGLLLATVPVVPTLDAQGDLTLSSGPAQAQGKSGGRGGNGRGHGGGGGAGENNVHNHAIGRGHYSHGEGRGLGHEKARGYGHHHDDAYVGGTHHHDGHDGDEHIYRHGSDPSFSAAVDNARRDFGRARSSAKAAWSDLWN